MATKRTPVKPVDPASASSKVIDSLAAGTTLVHEIPLSVIDPHPRNPRRELGDLGELAESIRAHGVKQPATVVPHPTVAGRYLTVMGHRRVAAALIAGRTTVPALIDDIDETEQLEVMLVENLQRVDLTISEEGAGYQGLLDLGVSKAVISKRTGRSKTTVDSRLRIAGLPEPVRRHVDHHQLTIEDALTLNDWKDTHADVWEDQLEKLSNPHAMVDVVFGEGKRAVGEREALVKARTDVEAAGYKLITGARMIAYDNPGHIHRYGITADEHAHCPGAEVHITGMSEGWLTNALIWGAHMCADPEQYHPTEFAAYHAPRAEGASDGAETDQQREWREEREQRIAEVEARAAVANARRTWLTDTLIRQGKDAAPAYAALADCAAQVAQMVLTTDQTDTHTIFTYRSFDASSALPADAVIPVNPLAVMTLTMLLGFDNVLTDAESIEAAGEEFTSLDLTVTVTYLTTLAAHGYELHDSEHALINAATAELEAKAEAAETEASGDTDAVDGAA